jgi:hypothetical protein
MSAKDKEKQQTQIHAEQWRVVSEGYKDTFDSKEPANRIYGTVCKEIKKEGEGRVILQYRPESKEGKASEWIDLKEFMLDYEEEDDDEQDEE